MEKFQSPQVVGTPSTGNTKEERIKELAKMVGEGSIVINNVADEEEPPMLFRVNGVDVFPKQSVALISGQKKAGKSNLSGLFESACAKADHQVLDGMVRCNLEDIRVLYIDTEQPKRDTRRTLRRMMKTAGYGYDEQWEDHGIVAVSVKDFDEEERKALVELAIRKYKPQLVIIDGIADLLSSINDEVESKELMKGLDFLSCKYDCCIVGMLHLNYGSGKVGGWAGTMAGKKFTDSFTVKKNKAGGYFTVEHEGRGEPVPDFRFKIVCPYGDKIGWWEPVDESIPAMTREDEEEMELRNLMEAAPLPCNNTELVKWLMQAQRWTNSSTAQKKLRKCAEKYGILCKHRQGRNTIWQLAGKSGAEEQELNLTADD